MPLIIIPAICNEKGSPFGDPESCEKFGLGYIALSMAVCHHFLTTSYASLLKFFFNANTSQKRFVMYIRLEPFTYGLMYTILCGC